MKMKENSLFRKDFLIAMLIALLAFIIRLLFIAFYSNNALAGGDSAAFWSFAEGIASGSGFRSSIEPWLADRPPLYPYFLAGVFLLFGKAPLTVFIVQALLGAVSAFVFYFAARRMLTDLESLFAASLFAIFPPFLLFTKQNLAEAIYIPIWVGLLFCLLTICQRPEKKYLLAAGLLLGLLALARREALFLGILTVIFLLRSHSSFNAWRKVFQLSTVIFVLALLTVLPWLLRNQLVLGRPILSSSGGINFMVGNNPLAEGAYTPPPTSWQQQFVGLGELARDQKATDLSMQWIRENPADFVRLLPKKLMVLWGPAHNLVLDGADWFLLFFAAFGFMRLFQQQSHRGAIAVVSLLPLLTTTLIGLIFVGAWRYRLIVYPGLILLAAYGFGQLRLFVIEKRKFLPQRTQNNTKGIKDWISFVSLRGLSFLGFWRRGKHVRVA